MAISVYKIKKWAKMLLGKSSLHVNQNEGKCYSKEEVRGYYNNLTEKITRFGKGEIVPKQLVDTGEELYFSIAVFQYGLAAYDLYLLNNDTSMLDKVKGCADWAVENQQESGGWITFAYQNKEKPFSSMAQGEAISLLARAFLQFNDVRYYEAAKKAKDFMLLPLEKGGTAKYDGNDLYLYEATFLPCVLNGWIFSAWGLYDYAKVFDYAAEIEWRRTVHTIAEMLPKYDNGYWSMYDIDKMIASPFYHKLHIAQLNVMYDLTGNVVFKKYAEKFVKYQNNRLDRIRAFLYKVGQKIFD